MSHYYGDFLDLDECTPEQRHEYARTVDKFTKMPFDQVCNNYCTLGYNVRHQTCSLAFAQALKDVAETRESCQ